MRIKIDTRQAPGCARKGCYNPPPYYRHHLGNDGKLAKFDKKLRKTYYQFRQCRKICDECHMTIHYLYEQELPLNLWKDWTPKGLRRLREKFIKLGKRWLAGEVPTPIVSNYFRAKWRESKSIYEATLQALKKGQQKPSQPKFLKPSQVTFTHE